MKILLQDALNTWEGNRKRSHVNEATAEVPKTAVPENAT